MLAYVVDVLVERWDLAAQSRRSCPPCRLRRCGTG